jgi:hypothetical protein
MKETSYWTKRIREADHHYKEWENEFLCATLEDYYRGKQWNTPTGYGFAARPYTLNLVYSTIKIKLANYLVNTPYIIVAPKAVDANFNLEASIVSAQRKEAFVNTLIQDPKNKFPFFVKKAIRDSFFRFGIIEVAYSASFIENPKAHRPEWKENESGQEAKLAARPEMLTEEEALYFRRISPKRFRVSERSEDTLQACDWYGYYDFANKNDFYKAVGEKEDISSSYSESSRLESGEENDTKINDSVKFWKIWDNRSRKKLVVLDSDGEVYHEEAFERSPIIDFRWDLDIEGYYPIPPVYHWLSQQDEINDTREQARNHRKRFVRKFQVPRNVIKDEEMEKFNYGPDGSVIFLERNDPGIIPIQNADLGAQATQSLITSREDFNIISGTSAEARGVADRQTATQARIIDDRTNIRETADTEDINEFITRIARNAILTGGERLTLPIMVETPNNKSQMYQEVGPENEYKVLNPADLDDGYDFKLIVDVSSTSPAQNEVEKRKFIEFVSMLKNFPELSLSPLLIRETAYKIGYRNERVIREIQNAALLQMMAAQAGQGQGQPQGGTGEPQRVTEANTPPTQDDTNIQLNNQLLQ